MEHALQYGERKLGINDTIEETDFFIDDDGIRHPVPSMAIGANPVTLYSGLVTFVRIEKKSV